MVRQAHPERIATHQSSIVLPFALSLSKGEREGERQILRLLVRELKQMATLFLFFLSIFFILPLPSDCSSQNVPWERVDEGLSLGRLDPPLKPVPNDSKIVVVRINPKFYAFKLLCASEYGRIRLTAKDWCLKHNLTSAINA